MLTRRLAIAPYLLAFAGLFVLSGAAGAVEFDRESARCESAIVSGARTGGVPQEVLHAISLTETGRSHGGRLRPWPWAVNLEGKGHWFDSREEALAFARHSVAAGRRSFDVGCFQINYHWHGHNFRSLEEMFEPDVGAAYAARFLGGLFMESGSWSAAAGAYHSRTPHYSQIYRARFDRILSTVSGTPLVEAAARTPADGEPTGTRRSRTKMTRGPLIIRVAPRQPDEWREETSKGRMASLRAERLEKALVSPEALLPKPAEKDAVPEAAKAPADTRAARADDEGWQPASGSRRYGIR